LLDAEFYLQTFNSGAFITAEYHVIFLRSRKYRVWSYRIPTQPGQLPVTTWVYKSEAANTV
jgi:hypothetical protein